MTTLGPIPLTQSIVRKLLDYDSRTGVLIWRERKAADFPKARNPHAYAKTWNTKYAGKIAGAAGSQGRAQITINNHNYNTHRIVWLWATGDWNDDYQIDHINGDALDNRISNLRRASPSQNGGNRGAPRNNRSGLVGVHYDRRKRPLRKPWVAQIRCDGVHKFLGRFATRTEAHEAYMREKILLFGEFVRSEG
jgi:hypothetical protein